MRTVQGLDGWVLLDVAASTRTLLYQTDTLFLEQAVEVASRMALSLLDIQRLAL